jgi:hypothetical protein
MWLWLTCPHTAPELKEAPPWAGPALALDLPGGQYPGYPNPL